MTFARVPARPPPTLLSTAREIAMLARGVLGFTVFFAAVLTLAVLFWSLT